MLENVLKKHLESQPKHCKVQQWIDNLPSTDQKLIEELKANLPNVSIVRLHSDLVKEAGVNFTSNTLRNHMRGLCPCQN